MDDSTARLTPLMVACFEGDLEMVKNRIEQGSLLELGKVDQYI